MLQISSHFSSSQLYGPFVSECIRQSHLLSLLNNKKVTCVWMLAPGGLLPGCSPGPSQSCSTCHPTAHLSLPFHFQGARAPRSLTTSGCLFSLISSCYPGDLRLSATTFSIPTTASFFFSLCFPPRSLILSFWAPYRCSTGKIKTVFFTLCFMLDF